MATSVSGNYCSPNPCALPSGCLVSTSTKCTYYSGTSIPQLNIFPGNNLDTVLNNLFNYVANIAITNQVVDTYADMITASTGIFPKRILVLEDENKDDVNITYDYWPGVCINWIIGVQEVNLNP